jgi:organic hydroperoxide reductase OsmC/OhrA
MSELKKVQYTGKTHTTSGRDGGASHSDDGRLDVKFSIPGIPAGHQSGAAVRSWLVSLFHRCDEDCVPET